MTMLRPFPSYWRWLALGAVLLSAVAATIYCREKIALPKRAIAAYLIPRDGKLIKINVGLWRKTTATGLKVRVGESIAVPAGTKIFAVFADGHIEAIEGPKRLHFPNTSPPSQEFISLPWQKFFAQFVGVVLPTRPGEIVITSPVGLTRFLNPVISWDAKENLLYDIAIVDPTDPQAPPRVLGGARPPVSTKSLQSLQGPQLPADRILEVLVKPYGESDIRGSARFLTAPDAAVAELPTDPAELLVEAVRALTIQPERTGDAWTALSRLPAPWRQSELAVRLRLKAAVTLATSDGLSQAREEGRKITP